ncbi:MAG: glycosyltransferase [Endomicrobium sp.]|jgi:glycosyltransferase involved in cell wall biosynthesis|nr:glycosyltransferase [Endomicrobium sp.]
MLKDILEIFLLTYNRKKKLQETFHQIFEHSSPIKNLDMTILNNKSTDGTTELIEMYRKGFPNINHVINKKNIGGNANIVKAFEMASKKYVWFLCDDDCYDWKYWNEIEEGLLQEYDAILTERKIDFKSDDYHILINTLAFLPAAIYKTELINDDVVQNASFNICYSLPHLALAAYFVNEKKKALIPKHKILTQRVNHEHTKGLKFIHPRYKSGHLVINYINSYQMITDKKERYKCCSVLFIGKSFAYSMKHLITEYKELNRYNICDILNGISFIQKVIFLLIICKNLLLKQIIDIYKTDKEVSIKLFNKFKTRIFSNKLFGLKPR